MIHAPNARVVGGRPRVPRRINEPLFLRGFLVASVGLVLLIGLLEWRRGNTSPLMALSAIVGGILLVRGMMWIRQSQFFPGLF